MHDFLVSRSSAAVYSSSSSSTTTTHISMRLHVAAVTVITTCCLLLRLEAFVTPRLVVFGRSSMHLPEQPTQQQQQQHQHQQQHHHHHHHHHHQQQLRGGMGTRHSLNCCLGVTADRTLRAGWTACKHTPLPRQQQQGSFPGDAGRARCKHAMPESISARWGSASSETGGGGEESNALLLRMDFEDADVDGLRNWVRRYPFGVALPVQPFSLVETEMGVDVIFRKKPTLGRGSQDGGLSFSVIESGLQEGVDLPSGPALIMRRNSEGQEIRKMFAERIVVKAIVKSLAGDGSPPPPAGTKVRAVLHEGLV